jgi:hypothetical protein
LEQRRLRLLEAELMVLGLAVLVLGRARSGCLRIRRSDDPLAALAPPMKLRECCLSFVHLRNAQATGRMAMHPVSRLQQLDSQ